MTDRFLFVIAPYVTGAAAVPACVVRCLLAARHDAFAMAKPAGEGRATIRSIWRWAIGMVALGHVAALGFPEYVLRWNHDPIRMLVVEGAGAAAGAVALAALIAICVRRVQRAGACASALDVIAGTLLLSGLASGVGVAIAFRWASSWSAVTVAPYVQSLLRMEPAPTLVGRLPLLARVHIFCAFSLAAVAPFTTAAQVILGPVTVLIGWTQSRIAHAMATARHLQDVASARLQPLTARVTRSDGEEN
ncbi:MAG TPA: respiratory nitrate reductase subunit gamma [Vicinamibacterales bacterium]|nr:respiratory nitrate reductase subunit gamma [Vicinamibacterales bacterium]